MIFLPFTIVDTHQTLWCWHHITVQCICSNIAIAVYIDHTWLLRQPIKPRMYVSVCVHISRWFISGNVRVWLPTIGCGEKYLFSIWFVKVFAKVIFWAHLSLMCHMSVPPSGWFLRTMGRLVLLHENMRFTHTHAYTRMHWAAAQWRALRRELNGNRRLWNCSLSGWVMQSTMENQTGLINKIWHVSDAPPISFADHFFRYVVPPFAPFKKYHALQSALSRYKFIGLHNKYAACNDCDAW